MAKYTIEPPSGAGPAPAPDSHGKYTIEPPASSEPSSYDAALSDARKATKGDTLPDALYQGATLGFGKDLDALLAEGTTAAKNAMTTARGGKPRYSAKEAAQAIKQTEQENAAKFRKAHPVGSVAAELGGALLTPGVGLMSGLLEKLGFGAGTRAVALGTALGGAGAAGESDGSAVHRLAAVPAGALLGGVTGGLVHGALNIPGAIAGTKSAVREALDRIAIANDAQKTGEISPKARERGEKIGKEYVRRLVKKEDPTLEKLKAAAAVEHVKPITGAEAVGRNARTQLKVMGRRTGETPAALEAQLYWRNQETPQRVLQDFADVAGIDPESVHGDMEATAKKLRAAAEPLYKAWHAQTGVDSEELKAIRQTKQFREAMGHAANLISADRENAYELLGHGAPEDHVQLMSKGPDGSMKPVLSGGQPVYVPKELAPTMKAQGFETAEPVEQKIPTAKGYDYVKRGFDQALEKYRDTKTGRLDRHSPDAKAILKVRTELQRELTNTDQPWGPAALAAFKAGGEPLELEDAFHSAKDLLSPTLNESSFKKRIERFTPAQMQALKAGVVAHARDLAMADRVRLQDLTSPLAEKKLAAILDSPEQASELVHRLKLEATMKAQGARMRPDVGSDTSETMLGAKDQESGLSNADMAHVAKHAMRGNWLHALQTALASPVAGLYRGAQAPIDEAARDVAGALLRGSPSELMKVLEDQGADRTEAKKVADYLIESGVLEKADVRASAAAGQTAGRRSGVTAEIVGQPDSQIDLNPDLSYTPPQ